MCSTIILLTKLIHLNFDLSTVNLIKDYLTDRKQFVQIDDKKSSMKDVTYGVPQGSILGPILFNLYVTDMADQTECACLQYADDTNLYRHCKVKDITNCAETIMQDLSNISKWSDKNNLIFNQAKTKSMLFSTRQMSKKHHLENPDTYTINSQGKPVERITTSKILGVVFHENLTWSDHIQNVIKSSYSTLRSLRAIKRLTPFHLKCLFSRRLIMETLCIVMLHNT